MKQDKKLINKRNILWGGFVLVIVVITSFFIFGEDEVTYEFIIVERSNVVHEVGVTGRVKPTSSVDLAFEQSGKIARVSAFVGDRVVPGSLLVSQTNGDVAADLMEAKANMRAEEVMLSELNRGTRPEEIEVDRIKTKNAEIALEDEVIAVIDTVREAYITSDDAVHNLIDQLFSNPRTTNPQLTFSLGGQLESDLEGHRVVVENELTNWNKSLNLLEVDSEMSVFLSEAKQHLSKIRLLLDLSSQAVNGLQESSSLSLATIDGWRSDVSKARLNINGATSGMSSVEEAWRDAQSALALARQQLALAEAGAEPETIQAQEAKLEQASARVASIEAKFEKTILRSPIYGIVTKQDAEVGEVVGANTVLVSIISDADFEIELRVTEIDVARLKIGNIADVTLDAYGSEELFVANIASIDPAEEIIDGVATYKTVLKFTEPDDRIKSGMTANVDILTGKKTNVVAIPQRSIVSTNGEKIVKVVGEDGKIYEVVVVTGLRGSDGIIEIVSGIEEGDKVITFIEE
jgi:HlyD family secretion protein